MRDKSFPTLFLFMLLISLVILIIIPLTIIFILILILILLLPILIVGCSPRVVRHSILENNRSKLGPAGPAKDYRKGSPSWQELEENSGYCRRNCPQFQRECLALN